MFLVVRLQMNHRPVKNRAMGSLSLSSARKDWIDVARGVGIILVVYGHVLRGNFSDLARPAWVTSHDAVIYSFHMPFFFVVAGLFLWPSIGRGRVAYVKTRWWAVIYPYFLWSFICGIIEIAMSRLVNSPITWMEVARIPFEPIEQFWFLYALFITQIIAVLVFPSKLRLLIAVCAGIVVISTVGTPTIFHLALLYLPYVAIGICTAGLLSRLADARPRTQAVVMGAAWLCFVLLMPRWTSSLAWALGAACAASLAVLASAMLIAGSRLGRVLAVLGRASLAIFALHTLFSAGTRIGLEQIGIERTTLTSVALSLFAGFIPWLLWEWSRTTRYEHLFGFGAKPARAVRREAPPAAAGQAAIRS